VREWLGAQAASGFVDYDPDSGTYALSPEQTAAFADESSPAFVGGGFQVALGAAADVQRIQDAFLTGQGVGWHEHGPDGFEGCRRFFEPGYRANLMSSWIPALDGVHNRLQTGGRVADVGCGHGASTVINAEGYPSSAVVGFDYHEDSIAHARRPSRRGASPRCAHGRWLHPRTPRCRNPVQHRARGPAVTRAACSARPI